MYGAYGMVIDDDDTDKKWRTHETEYNSTDSQIISDSTGRIDIDSGSLGPASGRKSGR